MNAVSNEGSLRGRVAVVAGATRGAGRGIAAALGEAGATVICTGRSTARADAPTRSDYDRPETIEQTAELVTNLGGVGIPVAVDHLEPAQVAALAERIRGEHGRINVLVNDIWGAERLKGGPAVLKPTTVTPAPIVTGIDLGDRLSHVCVLDVDGEVVSRFTLASTPAR